MRCVGIEDEQGSRWSFAVSKMELSGLCEDVVSSTEDFSQLPGAVGKSRSAEFPEVIKKTPQRVSFLFETGNTVHLAQKNN